MVSGKLGGSAMAGCVASARRIKPERSVRMGRIRERLANLSRNLRTFGDRGCSCHFAEVFLSATNCDALHWVAGARWDARRLRQVVLVHMPLGHDLEAMHCVGFVTTLQRGTEWAATGKVTLPLPKDFPTADKVSPVGDK